MKITATMIVLLLASMSLLAQQGPGDEGRSHWTKSLAKDWYKRVEPPAQQGYPMDGSVGTHVARSSLERLDSIIATDAGGTPTSKTTFSYDASSRVEVEIVMNWDGTTWQNYKKSIYSYNNSHQVTELIFQNFTAGQWVNSGREVTTYDGAGNRTSFAQNIWDGSQWTGNGLFLIKRGWEYNSNNDVTQTTMYTWMGGGWSLVSVTENTYNSDDLLELAVTYDVDGTQWDETDKMEYSYDGNGFLVTYIYSYMDNGQWKLSQKISYTNSSASVPLETISYKRLNNQWVEEQKGVDVYDGNGDRISRSYWTWDGSQWVNFSHSESTYDALHGMTTYFTKSNWSGSDWLFGERIEHDRDASVNPILVIDPFWITESKILEQRTYALSGGTWNQNGHKVYYYSVGVTGIDDPVITTVQLFPNPASDQITIQFETRDGKEAQFRMFDSRGAMVCDQPVRSGQQLDVRELPAGAYHYRLDTATGSRTGRVVVQ